MVFHGWGNLSKTVGKSLGGANGGGGRGNWRVGAQEGLRGLSYKKGLGRTRALAMPSWPDLTSLPPGPEARAAAEAKLERGAGAATARPYLGAQGQAARGEDQGAAGTARGACPPA